VDTGTPQPVDITFENRGDRLLGLGLINGVLRVLTLGLYSFWGRTEVRRRIWSFTRINGEPLEYTGTGKELFFGFLIAFALIALPLLLAGVAVVIVFPGNKTALGIYQAVLYLLFFLLFGNAIYRAQRYRLSRTHWRGISGALTGSPARYGWAYFWTLALPILGAAFLAGAIAELTAPAVGGLLVVLAIFAVLWLLPWRANKLQAMLTRDIRFGDAHLVYDGASGPLYKRYLLAWLGCAFVAIATMAAVISAVTRAGLAPALGNLETMRDLSKLPPDDPMSWTAAVAGLEILVIVILGSVAAAIVTAWYRAHQMNHFARSTAFHDARFRLEARARGLIWLVISNWFIAAMGLLIGFLIGGWLAIHLDLLESEPSPGPLPREPGLAAILTFVLPIALVTSVTSTFAQFRRVRYFMSRLKLDGPVDLDKVRQGQDQGLRRGEGLAQVFDIDAF
jgi:uncharacterized membrane protein YjgN (DUF898 family)